MTGYAVNSKKGKIRDRANRTGVRFWTAKNARRCQRPGIIALGLLLLSRYFSTLFRHHH